jgi:uncharacterized HAD superfamily protein
MAKMRKQDTSDMDLSDRSWAKEIVDTWGKEIPIIKDMAKSSPSAPIHFRVPSEYIDLAEVLVYKSNKYLESVSQVYRSANHIGMIIIAEIVSRNTHCEVLSNFINLFGMKEEIDGMNQTIDVAMKWIDSFYKSYEKGILSMDQLDDKIQKIMEIVPEKYQKVLNIKIRALGSGGTLSSLLECRQKGYNRKD